MKKILLSALVLAGISATAQVKVGSNPTTIDTGTTNFQVEGTTTAEQFVILKDGKVGIGTTTPSGKLDISTTGTTVGDHYIYLNSYSTNTGWQERGGLYFRKSHTNTLGDIVATPNSTQFGEIGFAGVNADGLQFNSAGINSNQVGAAATGIANGGNLNFFTASGISGGIASRMVINHIGNIGINTFAPTAKLHVARVSPVGTIETTGTTVTGTGTNFQSVFSVGDVIIAGGVNRTITAIASQTSMTVSSALPSDLPAGSKYTSSLGLFSGGNVGIGVAHPLANLDVRGTVGNPTTSGTETNAIFRVSQSGSAVLDFGIATNATGGYALGAAWLQATNRDNLVGNFPILLNPTGGKVGIGNVNPSALLSIGNSTNTSSTITLEGLNFNIIIGKHGATTFSGIATNAQSSIWTNSAVPMVIGTNMAQPVIIGSANTERVRITETGKVGIGTDTPLETLEVNGAIKIGNRPDAGASNGTIRFNSTINKFQGYVNGAWVDLH